MTRRSVLWMHRKRWNRPNQNAAKPGPEDKPVVSGMGWDWQFKADPDIEEVGPIYTEYDLEVIEEEDNDES